MQNQGLNDFQINAFLSKTGFKDVVKGYCCRKGDLVVLKSGYTRLMLTRDFKHYAMPSSMTDKDWKQISLYRQHGVDIAIFITREYLQKKFIEERKRNAPIPTEAEIISKYACKAIKKENGVEWIYQATHTGILHIRGMKFTLYDVNNWKGVHKWAGNEFVADFFKVIDRPVLNKIAKYLELDIDDVRDNYKVARCQFPKG